MPDLHQVTLEPLYNGPSPEAVQFIETNLLLDEFLDILKPLVREPSVIGNEHAFFRVLRRDLEEIGVEVHYLNGVLVAQGNRPNEMYLSAHIDRHGLLCTGPNEFEYTAFISSN